MRAGCKPALMCSPQASSPRFLKAAPYGCSRSSNRGSQPDDRVTAIQNITSNVELVERETPGRSPGYIYETETNSTASTFGDAIDVCGPARTALRLEPPRSAHHCSGSKGGHNRLVCFRQSRAPRPCGHDFERRSFP